MEFYDVVSKRRSIRSYSSKPVPADAVKRIADAVEKCPTACNRQPYRLLIISDETTRKKICSSTVFSWLASAPVIAVMLCNDDGAWHRMEGDSAAVIDASIAMEHFVLAATAEGLGTCWVCAFDRKNMGNVLGISSPWKTFALSPLGYGDEQAKGKSSKGVSELVKVIGEL